MILVLHEQLVTVFLSRLIAYNRNRSENLQTLSYNKTQITNWAIV
jgi:hypothetical protein